MEMEQRGDWVVPTFNNTLRTDKPPLHYFLMIVSYKIFSVSAFSARLFSALAGIATTLIIYLFGRKSIDEKTAFLSSLIFISSIQVAIQFHLAVPDPFLILFCTTSLFLFYNGLTYNGNWEFNLAYACAALAFLSKGPIAIIIIGTPIFFYLLLKQQMTFESLKKIKLFSGAVIFCLIALPWFLAVTIQTQGEWTRGFLFDHNLNRFSSTMEGHRSLPGIAIVALLASLLPASFFLPQAFWLGWKHKHRHPLLLLSILICIVVVGFFSLSRTFLPGYIAPCIPFASLLLGYFLQRWISRNKIEIGHWTGYLIGMLLTMALPASVYLALTRELPGPSARHAFLLVPFLIGALVSLFFFFKRDVIKSLYSLLGVYMVSSVILFYGVIPKLMNHNPVQLLLSGESERSVAAIYKSSNAAFVFEFGRPLPLIESVHDLESFVFQNPSALIFTRASNIHDIDTAHWQVKRKRDLFETSVTVILKRKTSASPLAE